MQNFVQDAVRTESVVSREERLVDLDNVKRVFEVFVNSSELLDIFKKWFFYKRVIGAPKVEDTCHLIDSTIESLLFLKNQLIMDGGTLFEGMSDLGFSTRLMHSIVGAGTESGEMVDSLIPALNGQEIDYVNVIEEFGDSLWYFAIGLDFTGLSEDEIKAKVINKLKARYPDKYNDEEANNRNLEADRKVLES